MSSNVRKLQVDYNQKYTIDSARVEMVEMVWVLLRQEQQEQVHQVV
jgi:hypothetical protein